MARSEQFTNDLRDLAVELSDVLDRIEAKLDLNNALGGDTPVVGWLQTLDPTAPIAGAVEEGLTKARLLELLGTFESLRTWRGAGHGTNLGRWRW